MKKMTMFPLLLLILAFGVSAKNYKIDHGHSKVAFNVTHLVFNTMDGKFNKFSGSFKYDEKSGVLTNVKVKIRTKSIDTNHVKRDKHLRSADFFNAKKFPSITYTLDKTEIEIGKEKVIRGTLNMHGVKKQIPMRLTLLGPVSDPWGNTSLIFKMWGSIARKDFGIEWNQSLKRKVKGMLIGEVVDIKIGGEAQ